MKITRYLVPSLLAGSLLAGGVSAVSAAHKPGVARHAFAYGQVSNLSASGFTLTKNPKKASAGAPSKTVQVALSTTTKEKARKGTAGTLANGEYALVAGAKASSGISAQRVLYSAKAFKAQRMIRRARAERILRSLSRHRVAGTVTTATSSSSLTITTRKGKTLTFAINAKTAFRVNKQRTTTAPAFTSGEKVRVVFSHDRATKTNTALLVIVTA
jgi:uncharacterized surface protein with fasciclin (FAS1) repeats